MTGLRLLHSEQLLRVPYIDKLFFIVKIKFRCDLFQLSDLQLAHLKSTMLPQPWSGFLLCAGGQQASVQRSATLQMKCTCSNAIVSVIVCKCTLFFVRILEKGAGKNRKQAKKLCFAQ